MTTDIKICTNALFMVSADEINAFTDESREARLCAALYPVTRDEVLQSHPWGFTREQVELAKTTDTPLQDYDYEYQIPSGTLRIFRKDNQANDYKIYGDKLYSNDDRVYIERQFDPGEVNYPAYFVRLLEYSMAEVLAAALAQDESMASMFQQRALQQMRKARNIDSQNSPPRKIPSSNFSLITRRGGYAT